MRKNDKYTVDDLANYIIVGTQTLYEIAMLYVAFCFMFVINIIISLSIFALFYYFNLVKLGGVLSIAFFSFISLSILIPFLAKAGYCSDKKAPLISFIIVFPIFIFFMFVFFSV